MRAPFFNLNAFYKYKKEIEQDVLDTLANKIETNSYICNIEVIPNPSEFKEDINEKLVKDINEIIETLKFSADIVEKKIKFFIEYR